MDASKISRLPPRPFEEAPTMVLAAAPVSGGPLGGAEPSAHYQQCDECGAAVDSEQRYCVRCGAHRRNVNDPAARYFSGATARGRVRRSAPSARQAPHAGGRTRGLGTALALAVVPVAVAVGVMVGRSSNNEDAQLLQALAKRQALVGAATTAASSSAGTSGSTTRPSSRGGKHKAGSSSHTGGGKKLSTTKFGTASQLAGSKVTQAQKQQGAAVVKKVEQSKGKSYVQQQQGLPGTVVVP